MSAKEKCECFVFEKGLSNPFNYTGGKHRYLNDMFEILPNDEKLTVIDPFFGGGDLSCHLPESWEISAFDSEKKLIAMHEMFSGKYGNYAIDQFGLRIKQMRLDKTSEDAFYKLRDLYNSGYHEDSSLLYLLICHSNSNRIRFNKKNGRFNVPFGKRTFNNDMKKKAIDYVDRLSKRNVNFECKNYEETDFSNYDLCLIDPPYLNTIAAYNENGPWKASDQDNLHSKIKRECKKFVYFGQIWSKGVYNEELDIFSKKHNVKILKDTTFHCSANRKKVGKTIEVMIWNF